jgi:hypothetical protein
VPSATGLRDGLCRALTLPLRMGNQLSVPSHWRPTSTKQQGLASLLLTKTGQWGVVAGLAMIGTLWLKQRRLLGKAFPGCSQLEVYDSFFSMAHAVSSTCEGLKALASCDPRSTSKMFFGADETVTAGVASTIGYLLADSVAMALEGDQLSGIGPALHHGIISYGFSRGISTRFVSNYHGMFLLNEASTVCLHLVRLLRGYPEVAQRANLVVLWLLFLVCRLVCNGWIFGNVAWHLVREPSDEDDREARRLLRRNPRVRFELVLQLTLAGLAQLLNLYWFRLLTLKLLRRFAPRR